MAVVLVPSVFDEIIGDDVSIFTLLDDDAFSSRQRRRLSSPEERERRRRSQRGGRRNHLSSSKTLGYSHSLLYIYTSYLFAREVQVNEEKERKKKGDIGTHLFLFQPQKPWKAFEMKNYF